VRDRCDAPPHRLNSRCGHAFAAGKSAAPKFVRQEPIGRFYVDFVCRDRHLIIELDGGQHSGNLKDRQRDSELSALGYRVIRIWNNDVIDNLDGVLQMLLSELEKWPLTPALSPQAGRGS
jgi:very-short-patch-repair endonuclease